MEDEKIIELYWQRSPQAIDETSRKYGAYCMRLSMNILMNREDSEENVNDTYLRTWNAIPPQRPQFFAAFLGRIARNLALNRYKARAAEKRDGGEAALSLEELAECLPSGSEPQDEAEAAAFSHLLSEFLRTESEEARRVFLQRYFMCCPVAQVADHFGFSESRVKSMLLRTRTRLAKYLESEGWTK